MANIRVREDKSLPLGKQEVEYVERKGIGHPDSLIDGIMERVSMDLSEQYLDTTGAVLHHNVDKGLIIGGSSEARFGYGKITRPIEVILTGRATKEYGGVSIPVDEIAVKAARDYLKEKTRFLDIDREVIFQSKIVKGSDDLKDVFDRAGDVPLANDTSFGIGFAPLTETERLALETERFLNSIAYKDKMPALGEDIKVMSVRDGDRIMLTIAAAFVAQHVKDSDEYVAYKERVANDVIKLAERITKNEVVVFVNNADSVKTGKVYLTKSGLSCEAGDDGSVGRGNRPNGLITPFRNMSLEAAAGKNPFNHVGKIYGILANEIAADAVRLYQGIEECTVSVVSQIGRPINDPKHMDIKIKMREKKKAEDVANKVDRLAEEALENIGFLTREMISGKHSMF